MQACNRISLVSDISYHLNIMMKSDMCMAFPILASLYHNKGN